MIAKIIEVCARNRMLVLLMTGFVVGLSIGPGAFGLLVEGTGSYRYGWFAVTTVFALAAAVAIRWWRLEQRTGTS